MSRHVMEMALHAMTKLSRDDVLRAAKECGINFTPAGPGDDGIDAWYGNQYLPSGSLERFADAMYAAGLAVGPGWQPIETAPRDSRRVIVASKDSLGEWRVREAWWRMPYEAAPDSQCWWCYDGDKTLLDASVHDGLGATHWMPLPAAPKPATD